MKACEDCGKPVYGLGCTWCNEGAYIEQQEWFDYLHEQETKHERQLKIGSKE